ncbi:RAMP superfamily CRISPR-associated protein [Dethiothermospora halolimnae]|uniref:RAMP superfamily CRISPR-associated protein n=1 Tax=Dethiothermospora halolimnae TaxID=3114390 RepID=UPI003CCBCB52
MNNYIIVEITNLEPLKIGSNGTKNQAESSKDYIPGSTLRGAIIYLLKKKLKLDDDLKDENNENYKYKILNKINCYNAYPYKNKEGLFIPTPLNLRIDKHDFREKRVIKSNTPIDIKNLLKDYNSSSNEENKRKVNNIKYKYVKFNETNPLEPVKIEKEYRLHHNGVKNKNKKEKDNIFRYESISKGHTFIGLVSGEKEIIKKLSELIRGNEKVYLGGSKGSGYGLCKIEIINNEKLDNKKVFENYSEVKKILGLKFKRDDLKENNKELVLQCLSDCMFRDENGQPSNHIDSQYLKDTLNLEEVSFKRAYCKGSYSQGFNMKWRARYPKEGIMKAGSIIKYKYKGKLHKEKMEVLESRLRGMRTNDGYGWIACNIEYPQQLNIEPVKLVGDYNEDGNSESNDNENKKDISDDTKTNLEIISKGLSQGKKRWIKHIYLKEKDIIIINELKASHIKNMKDIIKLKREDRKKQPKYNRNYMSNKERFSIKDENFSKIMEYIYELEKDKDYKKHKEISDFVDEKIGCKKAQLFYHNLYFKKDIIGMKREFLIDFLQEILYIELRKEERGE